MDAPTMNNQTTDHSPSSRSGFTLIEIIVAMAIIGIMAGIMVPMVHKVWESNEKNETRQKMAELKRAMVGDQHLYQNGIRMHYGFVGDNGELPTNISDLVSNSGAFANWNGPYLVGAFDPNDYAKDAWERNLIYTRQNLVVGGQALVATLASAGPDGIAGTADDLDENTDPEVQILASEVAPTDRLAANLNYVLNATTTETFAPGAFSADIFITYNDPSGTAWVVSDCLPLDFATVDAGVAKNLGLNFPSVLAVALPVGRVLVYSRLYNDGSCGTGGGGEVARTAELAVYVSDGLSAVAVNLPTLNYLVN